MWDHPQNGTRYCVKRVNRKAYAGFDFHEGERGIETYDRRKTAKMIAARLNGEATK